VGKLIVVLVLVAGLFTVGLNTDFLGTKAMTWVEAHPQDANAPKVMFWTGWWCDLMGDDHNAEKLFWQLYEKYPQENALVAEGLYRIAEIKANGTARIACVEYCQLVIDKYSSEEKWRFKASQLSEQVKNNVR
jgi:TolA-binding protein